MRQISQTVYLTPDQIEARIREREAQAILLPPGPAQRQLREEIARLHIYADMKRLFATRQSLREAKPPSAPAPRPEKAEPPS